MIQGPYSLSCNLTSRVYCMLVQTLGIASRMVFLYSSRQDYRCCEHTVTEVCVDGKWCLIDPRAGKAYRRADGRIASAREIQADREIMRSALTEEELKEAEKRGGALDYKLFHEFAICNYTTRTSHHQTGM